MRNIKELTGLIKGINFDDVINEKETMQLQQWVDKNRNLAYAPREIELIKLIDSVLADKTITDDERMFLVEYCNKFEKDFLGNAHMYILQGIVAGIICDGIINEKEVLRLQEWMNTYRDSLKADSRNSVLVEAIDEILADGIITADEQEKILVLLDERIEKSQFETLLNNLRKQVKERKNIGIELIEVLGNDDYINEIHRLAENALKKYLLSYAPRGADPEIIFISLVLIAMLHYEEGRYYESVRKTYQRLYSAYSEQKIEGTIRGILARYRKDFGQGERFINVALYNAIVPAYYLSAFFQFIYDIYKLNFEYDLPQDLYDEFAFVYEGLKQAMLSDGDDVQINVTRKTYKLIKTTKQLITSEKYLDAVIKLSIIVVRLIDKRVWDKDIEVYNPYLKNGFEDWALSLNNSVVSREGKKAQSELRSRWEPKYITLKNRVYLVPPIHRVKASYDYRTIRIEVENNGSVVYVNKSPDVREIIGGYQISVDSIQIQNPLGRITYKLVAGEEVIYSSKDKLYREVLAFDNKGAEIKNNSDFEGTAVFCYATECSKLKPHFDNGTYKLALYHAHLGDVLLFGDAIFDFSSLERSGVFGVERENHFVANRFTGEKFPVFQEVKCAVFESKNSDAVFEVNIDGHAFRVRDLEHKRIDRVGAVKYVIDLPALESGVHTVSVCELLRGKRTVLNSSTFALDKCLNVEVEECSETGYLVLVESDLLGNPWMMEISPDNYSTYAIELEGGNSKLSYVIPLGLKYYMYCGDEKWRSYKEEMWIGDISAETVLRICDSDVTELQVCGSGGKQLADVKLSSRDFVKEARIGFLSSYINASSFLVLKFFKDERLAGSVICYTKCKLSRDTSVNYNESDKALEIVSVFHGKGNVYFRITDSEKRQVYRSSIVKNNEKISIKNLRAFEEYTVTFYEKKKGLSLQDDRKMGTFQQMVYSWEDMPGKSYKIKEIYYDRVVRGKFIRMNRKIKNTYLRFKSMDDTGCFTGELFLGTHEGNFELEGINPVSVEICGDVIDGTLEVSITKDGDGLLLDYDRNGIMNTIDDPNAVDIFSYIINLKGIMFA